ncbi:pyridoxamine 5'-phosphate oxidase family protein [Paeniglutamicibacter cryotolerans]|uniref:Nitroimidazol reductase NimA-like FMN-containing flavoprotein (Pyridoxamine 5'-phosphate oxidase superfamily) n=1 Tax=Paeniglutamicibacter cryotolerans TaxID=670079 RepID=A0A839QKT3_9MICC|nr:pyridoxamine 5'-phosphate oxidase family protein [Paeniglutamicibacter cryotolerans]MBB2996467.1 nitroimidazol reductase NimA-like FMN-containing flavoprotein (pyridoxamine 5'-phosphate oxidase superfamily) [Paeniglutamicibacter cryotolerans]
MTDDQEMPATETLAADECWKLLRRISVGHLALCGDDGPELFPVNYAVDHGTVVFRTRAGTKLSMVGNDDRVAFEVDSVDTESGRAWSVIIKGRAEVFGGIEEMVDSFSLMLFPWEAGPKDAFVRIVPTIISGRRFHIAAPLTWWKHMDHG